MTENDNQKKPTIFYGWWLVAICLLMQSIGVGASLYLYSVVAGALEQAFPSGRFLLMMGATGLLLTMALMSPKVGTLLDRFPVRRVVIAGALIMGLGFILIALSTNIWQVIFCYALFIGAGMATLSPLTASTLLSRWFLRHRGSALGIAALGTQFGGLIYPPIIAHFIEVADWRLAIGGLGVFIILVMPALAYFTIIDRPEDRGVHPDGDKEPLTTGSGDAPERPKVTLASLFTQRTFILLVIAIGGASAVNTAAIANLSLFATDLGASAERGAYLVSLLSMLGMISSPLAGRFCDVWNIRLVASAMLLLSAVAALVFIGAASYPMLLLAALLQGITGGSLVPVWASLVGRIYGTLIYGQVMGATTMVVFGMTALAPPFAGWVHDLTGSYRLLFLVMFAVMAIAIASLLMLRIPATSDDRLKASAVNA
jgi:MFS family permease